MTFAYVIPGLPGDYDTRHEAVGVLAKHGAADDEVVAIAENCLVRWQDNGPEHLGDKHFGDRRKLATTHGAVSIDHEALVRTWNGDEQGVVESSWVIDCPVCFRTHKSDEGTEEARGDLIDEVLACCGAEWFPPSDWVEDCDVCGDSHRGEFGCSPPGLREPFPGVDEAYACAQCGWDGRGDGLQGPNGECPNCDSGAVRVMSA